ncbi:MAG: hypothetical protein E7309_06840 [Butyrivibrio sp.]|jgi:D-sedoheptulose 7-phosphate isomerase|nr:hypothetical protein [Butyrivibrio sp.]
MFLDKVEAMPAIVLPIEGISITAIANDYKYKDVFARQIEGLMRRKDVMIGISTSGNSENVYRAIKMQKNWEALFSTIRTFMRKN